MDGDEPSPPESAVKEWRENRLVLRVIGVQAQEKDRDGTIVSKKAQRITSKQAGLCVWCASAP